jgi:hypothetical protein
MNNLRKIFLGVALVLAIGALGLVVGTNGAVLTPFSDTFAGGVSGTMTRNVLPKSAGDSRIANSAITDDGTTVTVSEPIAGAGQIKTTKDPATTANTDASLLVNPATSASSELFLALLDNGSTVFSVDKSGNAVILGNITLNTNKFTVAAASGNTLIAGTLAAGATTITGNLLVTGSITGAGGGASRDLTTPIVLTASSADLRVSASTADAVQLFTLPAASAVPGKTYCFAADTITGSNREVDVEPPAGTDLIVGTTNATGSVGIATTPGAAHGIKNTHATAVRGNSTCIQSDGVSTWFMRSVSGTWAAY